MLTESMRELFDGILEAELSALPDEVLDMLDEVAVVVEDEASAELVASMGMTPEEGLELCGLHEGVAETERSVEDSGVLPTQIMLFRGPIIRLAGYAVVGGVEMNRGELVEQVRVTLLHEIGHQFGLDEDDLEELGYD